MSLVDDYIDKTILRNPNMAPGTIKAYRWSINHIKAFLESHNLKNLTTDKLDFQFALELKNFLVNANPVLEQAGMKDVSAAGVIKKFRRIFSHVVELGLISKNPFKQVKNSDQVATQAKVIDRAGDQAM